jgi:hypothetical protein
MGTPEKTVLGGRTATQVGYVSHVPGTRETRPTLCVSNEQPPKKRQGRSFWFRTASPPNLSHPLRNINRGPLRRTGCA